MPRNPTVGFNVEFPRIHFLSVKHFFKTPLILSTDHQTNQTLFKFASITLSHNNQILRKWYSTIPCHVHKSIYTEQFFLSLSHSGSNTTNAVMISKTWFLVAYMDTSMQFSWHDTEVISDCLFRGFVVIVVVGTLVLSELDVFLSDLSLPN